MKALLIARDKSKYCLFYHDHGHDMEGCIQLKDKIEALIRWGYLGKYIRGEGDQHNA